MAIVILKRELPNLGSMGETVKVKDGYARNFLIPYGFAVEVNKKNMKMIEHEKQVIAKQIKTFEEKALKDKAGLEKVTVEFTRKSSKDGKLFGSVTNRDIEIALKEKNIEVDRRNINTVHLKEAGSHDVAIKLFKDIKAIIKVNIVAEMEAETEETVQTETEE